MTNDAGKMRYWFKAKRYGWGWYPATWEGWLILVLWIATFIYFFREIDLGAVSSFEFFVHLFPRLIFLTGILLLVCAWTGEKPHLWWGKDDEK